MPKKLTTEEFVKKANILYKCKYDYSESNYINTDTKVKIACPQHNIIFWQTPHAHLNYKFGCCLCAEDNKKQNNLEKYGVENVLQLKHIREQIKQTNVEKFGFEHAMQANDVKITRIKTNKKRFGVENPMQLEEIKEKTKATMKEKYGFEYAGQVEKFIEQAKQTNLEKYGFEYAMQANSVKEKARQTNLIKYGVDHSSKLQETQDKKKSTNKEKYGTEYAMQKHLSEEALNNLNDKEWLCDQHLNQLKPLSQIANDINVGDTTVGRYLHNHGIDTLQFFSSTGEKELNAFINSLGYVTETNQWDIISPLEIDIFIPELNIALEYNGLFWHRGKGINYHKNKTDRCRQQNIHLIHVWEDQWIDDKEQTKDNIIKILNNVPLKELTERIEIDLSLENPETYQSLGYCIQSQTIPTLYSIDIWDCGRMILLKD